MRLKSALARIVHPVERWLDRLWGVVWGRDGSAIEPYYGYETPEGTVLRGRVLARVRRGTPEKGHSRLKNFLGMASLFLTAEVGGVKVATRDGKGVTESDEEGYFFLRLPSGTVSGDTVEVCLPERKGEPSAELPVYRPSPKAVRGIISDIDDTMLHTGAYSLARNLWVTLTGNALTRNLFPDAVTLMNTLHAGVNPVYYVSSSPWNLFHFLKHIFRRHGLVEGPIFLRDLGISKDKFISGTHGDHKGSAIDTILAANPTLPFVLIGDTGQHDAHVYLDAIRRHGGRASGGRIERVILRQPGPGPDAESREAMEEIKAAGVPLFSGPDYTAFLEEIRRAE